MADMLYRATEYMNAEDAVIAKREQAEEVKEAWQSPSGKGKEGSQNRQ